MHGLKCINLQAVTEAWLGDERLAARTTVQRKKHRISRVALAAKPPRSLRPSEPPLLPVTNQAATGRFSSHFSISALQDLLLGSAAASALLSLWLQAMPCEQSVHLRFFSLKSFEWKIACDMANSKAGTALSVLSRFSWAGQ
jgi:hypothetical protein